MLIGRKREQQILNDLWQSGEAEFLAVYGRRRVGKTFLIREAFASKGVFLEITGQKDAPLKQQLKNFLACVTETFDVSLPLQVPVSWSEAFNLLTKLIRERTRKEKVLIFLDELPWLAGRRSGLLQALDYEWNRHWSQMPQVKLVVCGSAASWMLEKLVHARGGLYNRLTRRMQLRPFSLKETAEYLEAHGFRFKPEAILELYMVLGGIPFYLRYLEKGKSVAQQVNRLCFQEDGSLFDEFDQLFTSLFEHAEVHEALIRETAKSRSGLSRQALAEKSGISPGGTLKKRLDELEASCFIERYVPYGNVKKDYYIKVVDEYSLFYLQWIEPTRSSRRLESGRNYWLNCTKSASFHGWCGYAFEAVCAKHTEQIVRALELEAVAGRICGWRSTRKGPLPVAQIDLLIDRSDAAITLCEMKFSRKPFQIDRRVAKELIRRMDVFEERSTTKKQLFWALVTPHGLQPGLWSDEVIAQTVTLADLLA